MKKIIPILIVATIWFIQTTTPLYAESLLDPELDRGTNLDFYSGRIDIGENAAIQREPLILAKAKTTQITPVGEGTTEDLEAEEADDSISDPLEPINRVFFEFNDKLYFVVLKPLATVYKAIVPQVVRVSVSNFFYNVAFPIRVINNLLQGKTDRAGWEFTRFMLNTTAGMAGFADVATNVEIAKYDEDTGQTLGYYGAGPGFYINWPVFGPSCLRDSFGTGVDTFLDGTTYLNFEANVAISGYDTVNETSLRIGDYEDFKKAALDPYIAVRDAYFQNRKSKIKE